MMRPMRVCVWLVEGTWQGCIDAAAGSIPSDASVVLLHVTPADVAEAVEAAAAGRLGREDAELMARRGRVEREVVSAVADGVDLLVAARDGDRSRLGPHSLGHATRFVVDHAPCAVLLVWPDTPPGVDSIPPPPHHPPH
jgi:nucleotide-binding universal stress UspA family protein